MKEKKPLKQHILDFFGDSSPFMTLVGKGALLVVLNVCWLALCLPVVTAGASTAALYAVLQSEEYSYLSAPFAFFRAFRIRAREATVLWLPFLMLGILQALDLRQLLPVEQQEIAALEAYLTRHNAQALDEAVDFDSIADAMRAQLRRDDPVAPRERGVN